MSNSEPEILFSVHQGIGLITLNRPLALHALTFTMIQQMSHYLTEWRQDPYIRAVIVESSGGKAFCAGGDIKVVAEAARESSERSSLCKDFFRIEYTLNYIIHTYPKPYIALIDGIVMGGGKGIAAHGRYRVVSENVIFAMPEAKIGFFPDVGGGYFLPRCPGEIGTYLALTCAQVTLADSFYIGFATHFVPHAHFATLRTAFLSGQDPTAVLMQFSCSAPTDSGLALHQSQIDACFNFDRIEDILQALKENNSAWAQEALEMMKALCPTSLKTALRQLRKGKKISFAEVMQMEYRLSQRLSQRPDFYEGVRAALIDKDKSPCWQPNTIQNVDEDEVESFFCSLGEEDLFF